MTKCNNLKTHVYADDKEIRTASEAEMLQDWLIRHALAWAYDFNGKDSSQQSGPYSNSTTTYYHIGLSQWL